MLVLSLIAKGSAEHPRFILANQRQEFWTGDGWSPDEQAAALFADEAEAGRVCFDILTESAKDKPTFRFTAPVEIEVRSDRPPTLANVRFWLMKAARLFVVYRQCGAGPTTDGVTLLSIDWTQLEQDGIT